jgi:hypothetical protein
VQADATEGSSSEQQAVQLAQAAVKQGVFKVGAGLDLQHTRDLV